MSETAFSRVVVVTGFADTDETVLRLGERLVHETGAGLTVLAAVDKRAEIQHVARYRGTPERDVMRETLAAMRRQLEEHMTELDLGVEADLDVSAGKPFIDIIHRVLDQDVDLVIKAGETIGDAAFSIFASTDQHLLRKCPCPVWLVNAKRKRPIRSVLAAVDIDEFAASEPETMNALNTSILETAAKIASFEGAELHVLHVWDAPAEGMARLFATQRDSVGDYVQSVRQQHQGALSALVDAARQDDAAAFETLQVTQHLAHGEARTVIPASAKELGVDVLVLGTVARTGIPGLIIGNTAEDVLNSVTCEVVTVKPPGYVSPVAQEEGAVQKKVT